MDFLISLIFSKNELTKKVQAYGHEPFRYAECLSLDERCHRTGINQVISHSVSHPTQRQAPREADTVLAS